MKCSGVARAAGNRSGSEERGGGKARIGHAAALLRRAKHWISCAKKRHGKAQPGMVLAMYRTALAMTGIEAALNRIVRATMGIELKCNVMELKSFGTESQRSGQALDGNASAMQHYAGAKQRRAMAKRGVEPGCIGKE